MQDPKRHWGRMLCDADPAVPRSAGHWDRALAPQQVSLRARLPGNGNERTAASSEANWISVEVLRMTSGRLRRTSSQPRRTSRGAASSRRARNPHGRGDSSSGEGEQPDRDHIPQRACGAGIAGCHPVADWMACNAGIPAAITVLGGGARYNSGHCRRGRAMPEPLEQARPGMGSA